MKRSLSTASPRIVKLAGFFIVLGLLTSCAGPRFHKVTSYDTGTVLVLPARDVVQNGRPHEKGVGSGKGLTDQIVTTLRAGRMKPVITDNAKFSHTKIANIDDAITDAKRLNADYVLITQLGEFQNAAPMSFRADFVWLQNAELYRTSDKAQVWRVMRPLLWQKTNIGNHYPLIGDIGRSIAKSINKAAGPDS